MESRLHEVESRLLRGAGRLFANFLKLLGGFFPFFAGKVNPSEPISCDAHPGLELDRLPQLLEGRNHVVLGEVGPAQVSPRQPRTDQPRRRRQRVLEVVLGAVRVAQQERGGTGVGERLPVIRGQRGRLAEVGLGQPELLLDLAAQGLGVQAGEAALDLEQPLIGQRPQVVDQPLGPRWD